MSWSRLGLSIAYDGWSILFEWLFGHSPVNNNNTSAFHLCTCLHHLLTHNYSLMFLTKQHLLIKHTLSPSHPFFLLDQIILELCPWIHPMIGYFVFMLLE